MFTTICLGTVISMESVSMCWIVNEESAKTDKTAEDKASMLDVEDSSLEIVNENSKDEVTISYRACHLNLSILNIHFT